MPNFAFMFNDIAYDFGLFCTAYIARSMRIKLAICGYYLLISFYFVCLLGYCVDLSCNHFDYDFIGQANDHSAVSADRA